MNQCQLCFRYIICCKNFVLYCKSKFINLFVRTTTGKYYILQKPCQTLEIKPFNTNSIIDILCLLISDKNRVKLKTKSKHIKKSISKSKFLRNNYNSWVQIKSPMLNKILKTKKYTKAKLNFLKVRMLQINTIVAKNYTGKQCVLN